MTFISKLTNSTYLFGAFQVRDGCFRAGMPCLFLHASLGLVVFATDMGLASASLITITAVVTAG